MKLKEKKNEIMKYTIVYFDTVALSLVKFQTIRLKYIKCRRNELSTVIQKEVGTEKVWHILYGHCKIVK